MGNKSSNAALDEFFAECDEIIQRVSTGLQSLERDGADRSVVDQIYRDMHTMKGSAQLFGMKAIGQLAHVLEACLDPLRKSGTGIEPSFVDAALKTLDLIDRITKGLRTGRAEGDFENEVVEHLPRLADEAAALFGADFHLLRDMAADQSADASDKSAPPAAAPVPNEKPALSVAAVTREPQQEKIVAAIPAPPPEPVEEVQQLAADGKSAEAKAQPVDTTIRVQVELLDRLMNLVGELVLVRNQVTQYSSRHDDLEYINMAQTLNVVTTELQNEVMLTRMQPIGVVVNKFQRVLRDLARDLGKKIDLTVQGAETELDKTLLEAIKDPLTHIVRNACDHGIETPAERKAASKPDSGHLMIRVFHDGGQVFIEVSDDGRGIDRERVVQKAIERKILTAEQASKMNDREVCHVIFLPGFSTAQQVTNVSGRGVGMDVVKTNIEKIGGSVEVVSTFKKGSTIRLKIPLTLAIVPALLVRSGRDRFAIPQVKLVELVRIDPAEDRERIELLQGRPMYRLRGDLLPIVLLDEALKRGKSAGSFDLEKANSSIANIIVLNAEGELFGLLVDEILDTADIVVKPLGGVLKKNLALFRSDHSWRRNRGTDSRCHGPC